jgi:hypothetical protein
VSIRNPPIGGPSAVVTDEAAAQVPIALPRISRGKDAAMIARLCGTRRAAPIPCRTRAAIRTATVGAIAQSTDATVKTKIPMRKTNRRPTRSPSPPPTRIKAPSMSR